jgi:phosphate transport system substrate-binding protein
MPVTRAGYRSGMRRSFLLSLLLLACGNKTSDPAAGSGDGQVTINASGATFQKAFQEVAIEGFTQKHKGHKINYAAGGSGKGRQDFADQVVDFACTDAPYKADATPPKGGSFIYVPTLLGAITVGYNLEGVKLQLSAEVLAKIFQREITTWNDAAIAADNSGATLPEVPIIVVRRSDGSGTTENFTKYLSMAAGAAWKLGSGSTVAWPNDTQAGNGNSGVAQIVKSTKGAIGYVDLSDAKASGVAYAAIKNQAGKYVTPTVEATTAAGEGIEVGDDLVFSALNAKGEAAYPITAQSWCMLYAKQSDRAKGTALKAYFTYMIGDAQKLLPELDFAPIPESLSRKAGALIDKIEVP